MVYLTFSDEVTYEQFSFHNLPPEFSSFKIFFIADIHRRNIKMNTLKESARPIRSRRDRW